MTQYRVYIWCPLPLTRVRFSPGETTGTADHCSLVDVWFYCLGWLYFSFVIIPKPWLCLLRCGLYSEFVAFIPSSWLFWNCNWKPGLYFKVPPNVRNRTPNIVPPTTGSCWNLCCSIWPPSCLVCWTSGLLLCHILFFLWIYYPNDFLLKVNTSFYISSNWKHCYHLIFRYRNFLMKQE